MTNKLCALDNDADSTTSTFRLSPRGTRSLKRAIVVLFAATICFSALTLTKLWASPAPTFSSTGDPGWNWRRPYPQGNSLNAAAIVGNDIWMVGESGTIVHSADDGLTWTAQVLDTSSILAYRPPLQGIDFVDSQHGWAVGYGLGGGGFVYRTVDGGATWTQVSTGMGVYLWDVDFVDENVGYIVIGEWGGSTVRKTVDGGLTWRKVATSYWPLRALETTVDGHAWAVGDKGTVLRTSDGWASYETSTVEDGDFMDVAFRDASVGLAVANDRYSGAHMIYRTIDGGANWTRVEGSYGVLYSIAAGGSRIRAVGIQGLIMVSTDIGVTWTREHDYYSRFGQGQPLTCIAVGTSGTWATGGRGGIIAVTDDATRPWKLVDAWPQESLHAVDFADARVGWAVGGNGQMRVANTTDGGLNWVQQAQPTGAPYALWGVSAIDTQHAVTVGPRGTVRRTQDGGITWQNVPIGTTVHLSDVEFVDGEHGWIVGWGGFVARTTDGGLTWINSSVATSTDLKAVDFVDALNGWAIGDNTVFQSIDGGLTWSAKPVGANVWLGAVNFTDLLNGWIVGGHTVMRTRDGGQTWIRPSGFSNESFSSVYFADQHDGILCAGNGRVLTTIDGGDTWTAHNSGATGAGSGTLSGPGSAVLLTEWGGILTGTFVTNRPPTANAGGPYLGSEGETVIFNAGGSTDSDNDALQYRWDFDADGVFDTVFSHDVIASHGWADDYIGNAILEVSDGVLESTSAASVIINNVAPKVDAGIDRTAYWGDSIDFSGSFSDPGIFDVPTGAWDFGDGAMKDGIAASHVYANPGSYVATLAVTDKDGGIGTDTANMTITKKPTSLTYSGVTSVDYSDFAHLSATLVDMRGVPLPNKAVKFTLGTQVISVVTDLLGQATSFVQIDQASGPKDLTVSFDEDSHYLGSAAAANVEIDKEIVSLTYSGDVLSQRHQTVVLKARLAEVDTPIGDLSGKAITFIIETSTTAQQASAITDASGQAVATTTIDLPPNVYKVSAVFAGDANYQATVSPTSPYVVWEPVAGLSIKGCGRINKSGAKEAEFGFHVQYNNASIYPKGRFEYEEESTDSAGRKREIELDSEGIDWLVISGNMAVFEGTANFEHQTDIHRFRVIVFDNGKPDARIDTFELFLDGLPFAGGTLTKGDIVIKR